MLNLMRHQLARNKVFLAAIALVLAAFEFIVCAIVASMDVQGAASEIARFAPPLLRAIIEQNIPGNSPAGILSFGWNHPVAHALLAAAAIALGARAVAGEIEGGVIELVLAQPISRGRYFAAHALFAAGALSAVLAAGILATFLGQRYYALDAFAWPRLAALFANGLLLQLALYAFTLLASAFGREGGKAALAGVLVAVLSFLLNALATLWDKAAFLKPWSLHGYFDPRQVLVNGDLPASAVVVLAGCALAAAAAAFARFARRDLP